MISTDERAELRSMASVATRAFMSSVPIGPWRLLALLDALAIAETAAQVVDEQASALLDALREIAAMECVYGDGCGNSGFFGQRPTPLCAVCRARLALSPSIPEPANGR